MKLRSEAREEILNRLAAKTGINTREDGSIAVGIVDALLDEIIRIYQQLTSVQQQAYLSTSTGNYTQLIADLLDVHPIAGESETEFKLRTSNAVYGNVRGNIVSIQQAIWNVPGVSSFDIRRFDRGTGSFSIIVYPQANANQTRIVDNVRNAVSQVVAEGIRFDVRIPEEVRIDLVMVVQFKEGLTVMQKQSIRNNIRTRIVSYINNLSETANLYINEIIERAMSTDDSVVDLGITSLKADGVSRPVSNIFSEDSQRFASGTIEII